MQVDVESASVPHAPQAEPAAHLAGGGWLRWVRYGLPAYWAVMFISSHVALGDSLPTLGIRDKLVHAAAYAGLAGLAACYWQMRRGRLGWFDLAAIGSLLAGYGLFDEITQIPVGRTCDPLDWLADILGVTGGLCGFLLVRRFIFPKHSKRQRFPAAVPGVQN